MFQLSRTGVIHAVASQLLLQTREATCWLFQLFHHFCSSKSLKNRWQKIRFLYVFLRSGGIFLQVRLPPMTWHFQILLFVFCDVHSTLHCYMAGIAGAWSPIGDVTTTMLWIRHKISTTGSWQHLRITVQLQVLRGSTDTWTFQRREQLFSKQNTTQFEWNTEDRWPQVTSSALVSWHAILLSPPIRLQSLHFSFVSTSGTPKSHGLKMRCWDVFPILEPSHVI